MRLQLPATAHRTKARILSDLALLITAVIWGGGFVAQRAAAPYFGFFTFNGIRFALTGVVMLPFVLHAIGKIDKRYLWIVPAGVILFAASAFQQAGLETTSAANGGFLTSVYVVLVPLLMALLWKKSNPMVNWVAAVAAVIGSYLLSTSAQRITPSTGDSLVLAGSFLWAFHVIIVSRAVNRLNVFVFSAGQFLLAGILHLCAAALTGTLDVGGLSIAWIPVLYAGLVSIGIGFTLQAVGQKQAPASDAALILSLESVFAAVGGYLILGEGLTAVQTLGAVIIFIAITAGQFIQLLRPSARSKAAQQVDPADQLS